MRIILSLLMFLVTNTGAYAQTPQVSRVDLVEYGIYTATTANKESAPNAAGGYLNIEQDIRHAATTWSVPAQLGVKFGYRYTLVGEPAGTVVPLQMVTIFPSPGLLNPATHQLMVRDEYDRNKAIGDTSFRDYTLDNDWEVVPGIWTFQIWYQGRMLDEQKFTLVKQ